MADSIKYSALRVQQTPTSEPFYLLSCKATELLDWCDVPRKKESFMAGYQRELDDRNEKITQFFQQNPALNIIPNAVIVASRKESVTFTPTSQPDLFECEIKTASKTFEVQLTEMIAGLRARMSPEEIASIALPTDEGSTDDSEEEASPPESYLATIVQQLELAEGKFDQLEAGFRDAVREYVIGVSKPGLIIDGQHRVYGAKNVSEFDIYLPVVLLPGLDYKEQVFHFYVLNNKAKPLTKTELRTIVSTSLGKQEISDLYDRFKQVGVLAEQTEWTFRMNDDNSSPFKGLVNFGLPGSKGVIPENVAYQIISKFFNPNKKHKLLYKDVSGWNNDPGKWDYRKELFYAMWRAVKQKYPAAWDQAVSGAWKQMLQKVSLLVLQEYLFDTLNTEMPKRIAKKDPSPFSDSAMVEEEVGFALEFLKEEFFLKEWKLKGLDTARGHEEFRSNIQTAITNQSANLGNMRLFRALP